MATRRLFCFPYAGGGASAFRDWERLLPGDIELWAVQLPGREDRFSERPMEHIDDVLNALVPAVVPLLDRPYAFFGHSLGALVCWELAQSLRALQVMAPEHVFVSAYRPPQLERDRDSPLHKASDAELVEELRDMGGTPEDVLSNPELMRLFLPTMRADLAITETHVHRPGEPLSCALAAFGGDDDPNVEQSELDSWAELTTGGFTRSIFPGHHFYLHDERSAVVSRLLELLDATSRHLVAGRGEREPAE